MTYFYVERLDGMAKCSVDQVDGAGFVFASSFADENTFGHSIVDPQSSALILIQVVGHDAVSDILDEASGSCTSIAHAWARAKARCARGMAVRERWPIVSGPRGGMGAAGG